MCPRLWNRWVVELGRLVLRSRVSDLAPRLELFFGRSESSSFCRWRKITHVCVYELWISEKPKAEESPWVDRTENRTVVSTVGSRQWRNESIPLACVPKPGEGWAYKRQENARHLCAQGDCVGVGKEERGLYTRVGGQWMFPTAESETPHRCQEAKANSTNSAPALRRGVLVQGTCSDACSCHLRVDIKTWGSVGISQRNPQSRNQLTWPCQLTRKLWKVPVSGAVELWSSHPRDSKKGIF